MGLNWRIKLVVPGHWTFMGSEVKFRMNRTTSIPWVCWLCYFSVPFSPRSWILGSSIRSCWFSSVTAAKTREDSPRGFVHLHHPERFPVVGTAPCTLPSSAPLIVGWIMAFKILFHSLVGGQGKETTLTRGHLGEEWGAGFLSVTSSQCFCQILMKQFMQTWKPTHMLHSA